MSSSAKRPRTPTRSIIDLTSSPSKSPAHKRQKPPAPSTSTTTTTSTITPQTTQDDQLYHTIHSLPNTTKTQILYTLAKQNPDLIPQITQAANTAPIKDFTSEVDRVDMCTLEGEGGNNPTEWDIPWPHDELPKVLEEITTKAGRGTRYETRRNAVFAITTCIDYMVNPHAELRLEEKEIEEYVEMYAAGIVEVLGYGNEFERVRLRNDEEWRTLEGTACSAGAEELLRVLREFEEFREVLGS